MAIITDYTSLKAEVLDMLQRDDFDDTDAAGFVRLVEGHLNRKLDAVTKDAVITCTVGVISVDISSLSLDQPIALFLTEHNEEAELTPKANGTFAQSSVNGRPSFWSIDNNTIEFDRPADQAYSLRLVYDERFVLSDAAPTNWLLDNHPDIYLEGALAHGRAKESDGQSVQNWLAWFSSELPGVRSAANRLRDSQLTVDPALTTETRFGSGNYKFM